MNPRLRSEAPEANSPMYFSLLIDRGADKSLAFRICSTTKTNFLGWVKDVRTTKS
jgi:hypothetical protein